MKRYKYTMSLGCCFICWFQPNIYKEAVVGRPPPPPLPLDMKQHSSVRCRHALSPAGECLSKLHLRPSVHRQHYATYCHRLLQTVNRLSVRSLSPSSSRAVRFIVSSLHFVCNVSMCSYLQGWSMKLSVKSSSSTSTAVSSFSAERMSTPTRISVFVNHYNCRYVRFHID